MKRILLISAFLSASLFFAQKAKIYETPGYSINVPEGWRSTDDSGIVNVFPANEIGAITISEYHDLDLPKAEMKKFILALYKSQDPENKISLMKINCPFCFFRRSLTFLKNISASILKETRTNH